MKRWIAGGTALLFVLGLGLLEMGVQAGNPFPAGVTLAKKDKEKEDKGLKEKEERLEAKEKELTSKEKELNAKEEGLKKKEEELKKREDTLKQQSKKARPRVQQGAGPQQPQGAPTGFSPRTTNPVNPAKPNMAVPQTPPPRSRRSRPNRRGLSAEKKPAAQRVFFCFRREKQSGQWVWQGATSLPAH